MELRGGGKWKGDSGDSSRNLVLTESLMRDASAKKV